MSEHCGYVVKVEQLRPHSNADRLQIATFFGSDTIVSLNTKLGDIGVYFPTDLQLGEKFCQLNDLVRRKDENGNQVGGYLDPVKRNIKAIKLRGEKSDGIFLPISCLEQIGDISTLNVGDTITVFNGEEICRKYIPVVKGGGHKYHATEKKVKDYACPTFYEHEDTEQLAYNLNAFKRSDEIEITLKQHGSSGRTGYLPVTHYKKQNWFRKLLHLPVREHTEYEYIDGSRRVVLHDDKKAGFYESDDWRHAMGEKFRGKLRKGETVYYEIVGFQGPKGAPIMASVANSKIKDKEFSKMYGDTTVFSYGCDPNNGYNGEYYDETGTLAYFEPCCDVYVYRMTMVNEDGDVVEYSPDFMRYRCEQMGVKTVLVFDHFIIPEDCFDPGLWVKQQCEKYYDGPDPIGKTHVREGVVARIINRPKFTAYKIKNFSFKVLEGIAKDEATAPDLEEAQELIAEQESDVT